MKAKRHVIPALAALALALPAFAAVPHRWTVETSRISSEQIEAYRGETIALEAALNAYGKPLETALESPVYLYWQTNGMGAVYWVTNATVAASNVLAASFLPSFAPAASAVQGFIGSPSSSYRASFVIRFRNAPGATPNVLPLPAQAIDFNTITVYNPPYYTKSEVDEKVANATPSDYDSVKAKANSAVQPANLTAATKDLASQSSLTSLSAKVDDNTTTLITKANAADVYKKTETYTQAEIDTKVSSAPFIKNVDGVSTNSLTITEQKNETNVVAKVTTKGVEFNAYWTQVSEGAGYWVFTPFSLAWHDILTSESDPTVPSWAKATTKPTYKASEVGAYSSSDGQNLASKVTANETAIAKKAEKSDLDTVTAVVQTWESFLDGSNVVFSITNYISGAYSNDTAKLRILELRDGEYVEVYNSRTEITNHLEKAKAEITTDMDEALEAKADKAWGKYTSAGGEAPSNTVYMTAPNTVFAGGMEYQRVAVGEGGVCVLVTKGAPVWTQGDEGVFKFQDDGGTNYFGFAKTDSYTVGADTDGISVSDNIVTLTYNVTMSGVPVIWYTPSLTAPITWEQLNLPDGTAVEGASKAVSWEASPDAGTEVCYINCYEAQGFFKATIEVAGSAKFMTNMPADLSGGILCTDGAHKVKVDYNNGNPKLVVVE